MVTNPSKLQSTAKHLKQEMDDAEAVRRAALKTECLCQEMHQCENVHQEGTLGTLPQGYGVEAPHEAGAGKEH